jgi:O-antigen ligase
MFKEDFKNKIYYYLFIALAFTIPVFGKLLSPIIILIGLNWILELNFREKWRRIIENKTAKKLMLFTSLYLIYLIGTLYTENTSHAEAGAFFDLEIKLSFLLFPVFFATIDFTKVRKDFYNRIRYAFILGCVVSTLLMFNFAVFQYFQLKTTDVFYYTQLAIRQHPSYLALYYTFAIVMTIIWMAEKPKQEAFKRNAAITLILYLQVFIVLLSSKAGILVVAATYVVFFLFYVLFKRKKTGISSIIAATGILTLFITLMLFPKSSGRFYAAQQAVESDLNVQKQTAESSVARLLVWESALEVIKQHPVFGVGTGDVKPELIKKYKEKGITLAIEQELNTHNQFLQTWLATGLPGLIILILCFILPAIYAIRHKEVTYFLFLSMLVMHMLVESMLERQAGIVFYGFFNALLFYSVSHYNRRSD